MNVNAEIIAANKLLGQWAAVENNGQAISDGVFTQTFTSDGKIISVIRDANEVTTFHHVYDVVGDELIIDGPREYGNPNHVRMRFWFDEVGDLMMEHGRGETSRFRRV